MELKLDTLEASQADPKLIPPGFDKKAVATLIQRHDEQMKARIASEVESSRKTTNLRDSLLAKDVIRPDEKMAAVHADKVRATAEQLAKEEPLIVPAASGHNPTIFPPFFRAGFSRVVGGSVSTMRQSISESTGTVSLSVLSVLPGGHIETHVALGALHYAESTETLLVNAVAHISGVVFGFSSILLGVGRAQARLTVGASADGPAGFRLVHGFTVLADEIMGATRFDLADERFATVRLPVNRGELLFLTVGLQVTAGCGGLVGAATSNVSMSGTSICLFHA